MFIGITLGLAAAICQSFAYLMTRHFVQRHGTPLHLLIASHIIMGLIALMLLPFVFTSSVMQPSLYLSPLIQCAGFFMIGQCAFFAALKEIESSRVSPLLGMKIIVVAIISYIFYDKNFTIMQWLAVIICFCGVMLTNWSGEKVPLKSFGWLVITCIFYSLSDINIKILVDILGKEQFLNSALLAAALNYIICGAVAVVCFFLIPNPQRLKNLKPALPFALCWFISMLFIFSCFGSIGPVLGNIVQSSRGIISVVIGFIIARAGHRHLESTTKGSIIIQRIVAATLMLLAMILFSWKT